MGYNEDIKILANTERTVFERGDMIIKYTGRLSSDILDYRYAYEHHKGNSTDLLNDKINSIKNSVALLESELDIYKEMLGISEKVDDKKSNRIKKILGKFFS